MDKQFIKKSQWISIIITIFFFLNGSALAKEGPTGFAVERIENDPENQTQVLHHFSYQTENGLMSTLYSESESLPKENEYLDKVLFYSNDKNTSYRISIYSGGEKINPQSGILRYVQNGDCGLGLQEISLNRGILFEKDAPISVVVEIVNKNNKEPITLLETTNPSFNKGGKTYISGNGEAWEEKDDFGIGIIYKPIGFIENSLSIKEVPSGSIAKLFTKPLVIKTEVSTIPEENTLDYINKNELVPEIYYTLNSEEADINSFLYDEEDGIEITSDDFLEVGLALKAMVNYKNEEIDALKGKNTFDYTPEKAKLSTIKLSYNGEEYPFEFKADQLEYSKEVLANVDAIEILAISPNTDQITINGEAVNSGEKKSVPIINTSNVISLEIGSGEADENHNQLIPQTYTLTLSKAPITYDYKNENIIFDEAIYSINTLSNNDGINLTNNSNITPYIGSTLYVSPKDQLTKTFTILVPQRIENMDLNINFSNKKTIEPLSEDILYSYNSELLEGAFGTGECLSLIPGNTLYYKKNSGDNFFASEVKKLQIPTIPQGVSPGIESIEEDKISLVKIENSEYRMDNGNWQSSPVFQGVDTGVSHHFYQRLVSTSEAFQSEVKELYYEPKKESPSFTEGENNKELLTNTPQIALAKDVKKVTILKTRNMREGAIATVMGLFGCGIILFIMLSYLYSKKEKNE